MNYRKEYILINAFKVFMNKGYDSTSISVLQKELGISRGAMYCYFKGKDDLFKSVIDRYVLNPMTRSLKNKIEVLTVPTLIDRLYRQQSLFMNIYYRTKVNYTVILNYRALLIQAAKHYDGFIEKYKKIQRHFVIIWKIAIRHSIKLGEIKPDTNIEAMSLLFANTYYQEIVIDNVQSDLKTSLFNNKLKKDFELQKQMQSYLYELIKL